VFSYELRNGRFDLVRLSLAWVTVFTVSCDTSPFAPAWLDCGILDGDGVVIQVPSLIFARFP